MYLLHETEMDTSRLTFLVTIGLVCLAFHPLRDYGLDPLLVEVDQVSGYQMSHFLMYFLVGYVEFLQVRDVVFFSIVWEGLEYLVGTGTDEIEHWTSGGIHGQFTDISLNLAGYLWGWYIRSLFPCPIMNCQLRVVRAYSTAAILTILLAYASLLQKM